ncbi:alpha-L-rhamnosidase C-terminal domain-containing protein [Niabella beijingensis]|uniref:alpha-L-rhamnosidase-related protein n=1 Tax=Niabella beijingensis TaxID=2872700 RepID=UPI001CBD1978|nr:alpha-L-rhamnosidase C-terminal domain-containing protein [Niabella beijingensis]MBZ4189439.1 alpha-L-rhamnosidase [Niabella beijingensis]
MVRYNLWLLAGLFLATSTRAQKNAAPSELRVDLVCHADKVGQNGFVTDRNLEQARLEPAVFQTARIASKKPSFSWIMNSRKSGARQTAYQVLVASSVQQLRSGTGNIWNSGKVSTSRQLGVAYAGKELHPNTVYYWMVRLWDEKGMPTAFSAPAAFLTDSLLKPFEVPRVPLVKTVQQPQESRTLDKGNLFYDFGKAAFGQLGLMVDAAGDQDTLRIHVGEAVDGSGAVERKPKGTIRYRLLTLPLKKGLHRYDPVFPADARNTGSKAIPMPGYIGEVYPFRYVEVERTAPSVTIKSLQRQAVNYPFDDDAAVFESSDTLINRIWELCRYTIKATSFTGLYVDGDRERIPYEADALINQLSHYAVDAEFNMARRSLTYLVYNATWPTEWSLQNLLIAWNDYLYSGDIRTVKMLYQELKPKLLLALARPDGLISTRTGKQDSAFARSIHLSSFDGNVVLKDIVDWPQKGGFGLPPSAPGESDSFVFTDYNSVVNAFHYEALVCMKKLALALGEQTDARFYEARAAGVKQSFGRSFIDPDSGIVKDGENTGHSSLHANMMALAFGLVPEQHKAAVRSYIRKKGMACSVYGAQFLLSALYDAGEAAYGLELLTATGKRSWYNMLRTGATMTTEAWDTEYKNNQDWNHAWGSAPANIIVSRLMGITPLSPAFGLIQIKPQPGPLRRAQLQLPTLRGRVHVSFDNITASFHMETLLPANTRGVIYLPKRSDSDQVFQNGKKISAASDGDFWFVKDVPSGAATWTVNY